VIPGAISQKLPITLPLAHGERGRGEGNYRRGAGVRAITGEGQG